MEMMYELAQVARRPTGRKQLNSKMSVVIKTDFGLSVVHLRSERAFPTPRSLRLPKAATMSNQHFYRPRACEHSIYSRQDYVHASLDNTGTNMHKAFVR